MSADVANAVWTTLGSPRPAGGAWPTLAPEAACVGAGRRLAPRFRAEQDRVAQIGLPAGSGFNLLLTWFNAAQRQCAAGLTDRAAANFEALERMPPQPDEPEPRDE